MRLLNTKSLELSRVYVPNEVPDYAILSHRWNTDEVTFEAIRSDPISQTESQTRKRNGFAKVKGACELALKDGYEWIWIDSCCIDKSSSAELQESINSMWRYYSKSNICYVYLADVPDSEAGRGPMFAQSEWFTRGWTLQELIAPACVEFYAANWEAIGTKFERYREISDITAIDPEALVGVQAIDLFSTAERLSWAAHRNVTREEDEAYSLLGLFDINMPLLYGEGREKAFARLQEAIYNNTTADQSIFLFRHSLHKDAQPLLADSPTRFCDRNDCSSCISQKLPRESPNLRYGNIRVSEGWFTQAHEQINTTVTPSRNEMSTVLSLLPYRAASRSLEFFERDTPRARVTHIAVLNHTLKDYPQGALCLLLRRQPNSWLDATIRLEVLPAVLPHLGDLVSQLQKEKLLVCPGPSNPRIDVRTDLTFSVDSDLFQVDAWSTKGTKSHSLSATEGSQTADFKIWTRNPKDSLRYVRITCRMYGCHDVNSLLTVQLLRVGEIWSIKEVSERQKSGRKRKLRTLFLSTVPADRCSIVLADGKALLVKVRRLPSSAPARGEGMAMKHCYQISVDYR